MTAIRKHDVTVAEGTFSLVLTRQKRVIASIKAPITPLGPLHLVFEMDRQIHPEILHREALAKRGLHPPQIMVGGIFGDIGDFVSKAAEGTFNTASKAIATIARPAFNVTRDVVSQTMNGISKVAKFLPSHLRNDISNAARVVARARLGDMKAKQFIHTIGHAAKAGVSAARHIGNSLLDGSKLVAKVIDLPVHVFKNVPGVGNIVTAISPLQKFDQMVSALQSGDLKSLKKMVTDDLRNFQGVASLIPGIGTGISSGLGAGLAALDGGSPLEIAINIAYGAIPIPVGLRTVTDTVLAAVLSLAKSGSVTDAALATARDRVPSGFPRDVFDTLVRIVVKKVPLQKAAGQLASHYIDRYAGAAGSHLMNQNPKLREMAQRAIGVGGEWTDAEIHAWGLPGRHISIGGDEPVAYEVGGDEPVAYEVGGDELLAYAIGGDEPVAYAIGGDEPEAYVVGGDDDEPFEVGGTSQLDEISQELLAKLPHPSEWLTGRNYQGA